jgi:hypothetical protein
VVIHGLLDEGGLPPHALRLDPENGRGSLRLGKNPFRLAIDRVCVGQDLLVYRHCYC